MCEVGSVLAGHTVIRVDKLSASRQMQTHFFPSGTARGS